MFWVREIAGWMLVLAGIFVFLMCLSFLGNQQVIEAGIVAGIGIFTFRGGIHLIKVATAARVIVAADKQWRQQSTQANQTNRGSKIR